MPNKKRKRVPVSDVSYESDESDGCAIMSERRDNVGRQSLKMQQKVKLTLPLLKLHRCDDLNVPSVKRARIDHKLPASARETSKLINHNVLQNAMGDLSGRANATASGFLDSSPFKEVSLNNLLNSTRKPTVTLSAKDKDEGAFTMCTKMYNRIKKCPDEQYAQRLSVLEQLDDAWSRNKLVLLTCLDVDEEVDPFDDLSIEGAHYSTVAANSLNFDDSCVSWSPKKPTTPLSVNRDAGKMFDGIKGRTHSTRNVKDSVTTASQASTEQVKTELCTTKSGKQSLVTKPTAVVQKKGKDSSFGLHCSRMSDAKSSANSFFEDHDLVKTPTPRTLTKKSAVTNSPKKYTPRSSVRTSTVPTPSTPSVKSTPRTSVKEIEQTSSPMTSTPKTSVTTLLPTVLIKPLPPLTNNMNVTAAETSVNPIAKQTASEKNIARGLQLKRLASGLLAAAAMSSSGKTASATVTDQEVAVKEVGASKEKKRTIGPKCKRNDCASMDSPVSDHEAVVEKETPRNGSKKLSGPKCKRAADSSNDPPTIDLEVVVDKVKPSLGTKKLLGPTSKLGACASGDSPTRDQKPAGEREEACKGTKKLMGPKSRRSACVSKDSLVRDLEGEAAADIVEEVQETKKLLGPKSKRTARASVDSLVVDLEEEAAVEKIEANLETKKLLGPKCKRPTQISTDSRVCCPEEEEAGKSVAINQDKSKRLGPKSMVAAISSAEFDKTEEVQDRKKLMGPKSKKASATDTPVCDQVEEVEEVEVVEKKKMMGPKSKRASATDTPVCDQVEEVEEVEVVEKKKMMGPKSKRASATDTPVCDQVEEVEEVEVLERKKLMGPKSKRASATDTPVCDQVEEVEEVEVLERKKLMGPKSKRASATDTPVCDQVEEVEEVEVLEKKKLMGPKSKRASATDTPVCDQVEEVENVEVLERKKLMGPKSKRASATDTPVCDQVEEVENVEALERKKLMGPKSKRAPATDTPVCDQVEEVEEVEVLERKKLMGPKSKRTSATDTPVCGQVEEVEEVEVLERKKLMGPKSKRTSATDTPVCDQVEEVEEVEVLERKKLMGPKSKRTSATDTPVCGQVEEVEEVEVLERKKLMGPKSKRASATDTPVCGQVEEVEEVEVLERKKLMGPKSKRDNCPTACDDEVVEEADEFAHGTKKLLSQKSKSAACSSSDRAECNQKVIVKKVRQRAKVLRQKISRADSSSSDCDEPKIVQRTKKTALRRSSKIRAGNCSSKVQAKSRRSSTRAGLDDGSIKAGCSYELAIPAKFKEMFVRQPCILIERIVFESGKVSGACHEEVSLLGEITSEQRVENWNCDNQENGEAQIGSIIYNQAESGEKSNVLDAKPFGENVNMMQDNDFDIATEIVERSDALPEGLHTNSNTSDGVNVTLPQSEFTMENEISCKVADECEKLDGLKKSNDQCVNEDTLYDIDGKSKGENEITEMSDESVPDAVTDLRERSEAVSGDEVSNMTEGCAHDKTSNRLLGCSHVAVGDSDSVMIQGSEIICCDQQINTGDDCSAGDVCGERTKQDSPARPPVASVCGDGKELPCVSLEITSVFAGFEELEEMSNDLSVGDTENFYNAEKIADVARSEKSNENCSDMLTAEQSHKDEIEDVEFIEIANDNCRDVLTAEHSQSQKDKVEDEEFIEIASDNCSDVLTAEHSQKDEIEDVEFVEVANDSCNDVLTTEQCSSDNIEDIEFVEMPNENVNDVLTTEQCIADNIEVAEIIVETTNEISKNVSCEERGNAENIEDVTRSNDVSSVGVEQCSGEADEDVEIVVEMTNAVNNNTLTDVVLCEEQLHDSVNELNVGLHNCRPSVAASCPVVLCVDDVELPARDRKDGSLDHLQNGELAVRVEQSNKLVLNPAYDEIALSGCQYALSNPQIMGNQPVNGVLHEEVANGDTFWTGDLTEFETP